MELVSVVGRVGVGKVLIGLAQALQVLLHDRWCVFGHRLELSVVEERNEDIFLVGLDHDGAGHSSRNREYLRPRSTAAEEHAS